jgi:hypothetical protein
MQIDRSATHREAYPKFDIFAAKRAWRRRAPLCEFEAGEEMRIGDLLIREFSSAQVWVSYLCLLSEPAWRRSEARFDLVKTANAVDRSRVYVRCPGCGERKTMLFLRGRWRCARCHDLRYRNQLLDRTTRRWDRQWTLQELVGGGRPPRMSQQRYRQLRETLKTLQRMPRRFKPELNTRHTQLVTSTWRRLDEAHPEWCGDYVALAEGYALRSELPSASPPQPHPPTAPAPSAVVRANPWYDDGEDPLNEW